MSSAHAKMLELVASLLLDRADVAPGGAGLALSLSLFSKAAFRGMLQERRALEAFLYLRPYMCHELRGDKDASPGFWELHDALLGRAASERADIAAEVRGMALRGGGASSPPPQRSDAELEHLLHEVRALGPAMENGDRVDANAREDLEQFVRDALQRQQLVAHLQDEVKALRARVHAAEKEHNRRLEARALEMLTEQARESSADRQPGERRSGKRPLDTSGERRSTRSAASAPGRPLRTAAALGSLRTILHPGCTTSEPKPNVRIFPHDLLTVQCMMQYTTRPENGDCFEVLLVLQRSGRLLCFKRPWPKEHTGAPAALANEATLVGSEHSVLAGPGRNMLLAGGEDGPPPSMERLGNLDKMVVCVDGVVRVYESHLERFAHGLKVETKLEMAFKARLPPLIQSSNVRSVAHHPVDKNLYAISTGDGSILVQSFHLHDQFQTIPGGGPPPLIAFSASGELLVSAVGACGEAVGHLQTRNVPETSLAPHSNATVRREDCANDDEYRREKAAEKARNKVALEEWIEAYRTEGRGSAMIDFQPLESAVLPQGMPVRVVPVSMHTDGEYKDCALLAWPTEVEVWKLRPLEKMSWKKMVDCTCTATCAFTASGRLYVLVGTSQGELHLCSTWRTASDGVCDCEPMPCAPTNGHCAAWEQNPNSRRAAPVDAGAQRRDDRACSSRRARPGGNYGDFGTQMHPRQPVATGQPQTRGDVVGGWCAHRMNHAHHCDASHSPQALLYLGFADGSVRAYSMGELFEC